MNRILLFVLLFLIIPKSFCQDALSIEKSIESCLDSKTNQENWNTLINYFEGFLVKNGFGEQKSIEKAYFNFIKHRSEFPPKRLPKLESRKEFKDKLLSWGILTSSETIGKPFIDCFYSENKDFGNYPQSSIKDIISIGDAVITQNLSPHLINRGLAEGLKQDDFKRGINKKAIILLNLVELIYLEEFLDGTAGRDNPILVQVLENNYQKSGLVTVQGGLILDENPSPIGGLFEYFDWIYRHNQKLDSEEVLGNDYRSIVSIDVDEHGNVTNILVSRGIGRGFDEEAQRLIKQHTTQKWQPAISAGTPLRTTVKIVVDFRKRKTTQNK